MTLDLWKSNRTNHVYAYLYKQVNGSVLKHEEIFSSLFRVREVRERNNNNLENGGFYKSSKDILILETSDKVEVSRNDYIKYLDRFFVVVDVKTKLDNQQMMTNKLSASRKTTITLRGAIK